MWGVCFFALTVFPILVFWGGSNVALAIIKKRHKHTHRHTQWQDRLCACEGRNSDRLPSCGTVRRPFAES